MKFRTPHKTAEREAYEEAGVVGKSQKRSIGTYEYDKRLDDGLELRCRVTVFPLTVSRLDDEWPEAGQRQRHWYSAFEAAHLVDEPDLRELILLYRPKT